MVSLYTDSVGGVFMGNNRFNGPLGRGSWPEQEPQPGDQWLFLSPEGQTWPEQGGFQPSWPQQEFQDNQLPQENLHSVPQAPFPIYPMGPSRPDNSHRDAWVQPWSDGSLRPSKKPGTLVLLDGDNHFTREDTNGQYVPTTARLSEGWILAARECIRDSAPKDPRVIAAAGIALIKILRTGKGKVGAAMVELALLFTPIPLDEAAAPIAVASTIALGGTMAVAKRRKELGKKRMR